MGIFWQSKDAEFNSRASLNGARIQNWSYGHLSTKRGYRIWNKIRGTSQRSKDQKLKLRATLDKARKRIQIMGISWQSEDAKFELWSCPAIWALILTGMLHEKFGQLLTKQGYKIKTMGNSWQSKEANSNYGNLSMKQGCRIWIMGISGNSCGNLNPKLGIPHENFGLLSTKRGSEFQLWASLDKTRMQHWNHGNVQQFGW